MVAIPNSSAKVDNSEYSKYSIESWKTYCEKYDIEFLLIDKNLDERFTYPIWNKELIYQYGMGFDKIGIIDSDTIIHPNAPNIFEQFSENEFCGVNDLCDLDWLFKSIDDRQKFFPDTKMDIFKYVNAGILFFGKKYLDIFKKLLNLYLIRKEEIESIKGGGKEQTLLNFTLQQENVPITLLDPCWNLLSIHRKNMFTNNWQLHGKYGGTVVKGDEFSYPHFIKYAWIYHFTGFPIEDRTRLMQLTWELLKD